jgi:hypothetical protein
LIINVNARETGKISPGWKDPITCILASLALLGFAWFIIYLLGRTSTKDEIEWTRSVYLLTGVESIVFAAAGFLFGREVHRSRAENAEKRAGKAEIQATESQKRATAAETKGKSLTAAIAAKKKGVESRGAEIEAFGPESATALTQADLKELEDFAQQLFPL